jgi:hypothetical protein
VKRLVTMRENNKMAEQSINPGHREFRLVIIDPESARILTISDSGANVLPREVVPTFRRIAESLTEMVKLKYGVRTIQLALLPPGEHPSYCAVHEIVGFERQEFGTLSLTAIDDVAPSELSGEEEATVLQIVSGEASELGEFAKVGWIEQTKDWIKGTITDRTVVFTGEIKQLNAASGFCLLHLGTRDKPSYWLKAVGEPNTHEFGITMFLAKGYPDYLPRVVATRSDWNAWVMEDFGRSLDGSTSLMDFEIGVRKLAFLQKQLIGRSDELFAVCCLDHRTETLRAQIDGLIEYLDEAMHLQTSTKATKLPSKRLREIGSLLHQTCYALEDLGIPDSLLHNDISPGNILINGDNCVFTDWCEAVVGNPFITLEQVCVHAANNTPEPDSWKKRLRNVYRACWRDLLTDSQCDRALQLIPMISVLSYLHGRGDWLATPRRDEPGVLSYSRSLARHMERISRSPEFAEVLCQRH